MSNPTQTTLCLLFTVGCLALAPTTLAADTSKDAGKIKKCQDAAGKWHYGDSAAEECNKSVQILSNEGVKKKEIAAPPTAAELAEREKHKEEIEQQKQTAEEQAKRDKLLLQSYAVEDDIILVRDRKLSQIEGTIKASEGTLSSLRKTLDRFEEQKKSEDEKNDTKAAVLTEKGINQSKKQIANHEALIVQRREEQERLRKQYAEELVRYRELKAAQASKPAPKKTAVP